MTRNDDAKLKDDTRIRYAVERAEAERKTLGIQSRSADIHAAAKRWKQKKKPSVQHIQKQPGKVREFIVLIKPAPKGNYYLAHCPTVSGCYTRGTTADEARSNLIERLTQRFSEEAAKGVVPSIEEDVYLETIQIPVPMT